jgi:hypothetical protein
MIRTAGNIIALTSLLSGVHCYFLHHERSSEVVIKAGNILLGEGIQMTSDRCAYRLNVYLEVDELVVSTWHDGAMINQLRIVGDTVEDRRDLLAKVVKILMGETVFE